MNNTTKDFTNDESIYDIDNIRGGVIITEDDLDKGYHEPEDDAINIETINHMMLDNVDHEVQNHGFKDSFIQLLGDFYYTTNKLARNHNQVTLKMVLKAWKNYGQDLADNSLIALADNQDYQNFLNLLIDLETIVYSFHDVDSNIWAHPQA